MGAIKKPEIYGIPVIGTLFAAFLMFSAQWMWWGSVFKGSWPELNGLGVEDIKVEEKWWVVGYGILLAQAIGVALLMKSREWRSLSDSLLVTGVMGFFFAFAIAGYEVTYLPDHSFKLWALNGSGYWLGWMIAAATIFGFKARKSEAPAARVAESSEKELLNA